VPASRGAAPSARQDVRKPGSHGTLDSKMVEQIDVAVRLGCRRRTGRHRRPEV